MNPKTKKIAVAIDLMMEDLHTIHPNIRIAAKKEDCEEELDILKEVLLDYLLELKNVNDFVLDK